jgi:hypothetical protein
MPQLPDDRHQHPEKTVHGAPGGDSLTNEGLFRSDLGLLAPAVPENHVALSNTAMTRAEAVGVAAIARLHGT